MCIPPHSKRSTHAFSLVELLVVMTIIAVLAVLSFGFAKNSSVKAKAAKSVSNLRQVYGLVQNYANDNDGILVPAKSDSGTDWYMTLFRYVNGGTDANAGAQLPKSILRCPAYIPPNGQEGAWWVTGYGMNIQPGLPTSNGFNWNLWSKEEFRMVNIEHPTQRILIGCNHDWPLDPTNKQNFIKNDSRNRYGPDRAGYLFFDGHVETLSAEAAFNGMRNPGGI